MRRLVASLPGRVLCSVVVLSLILPSLLLGLAVRAHAQIATLPVWAVVEFTNLKAPETTYGRSAAAAVIGELAKTRRYDVVPAETVSRAIETLGVDSPPRSIQNLMRVAQEVRATSVVSGDIVDYEVQEVNGGRLARVSLRVVVYDVASGVPVNGAAVVGTSTTRPAGVSDDTLINDAIAQAASTAIGTIQSKSLPVATVQNTTVDSAKINQGTRSGFRVGQPVIILRGREQVANATVTEVEPDSSTIRVTRELKGVRPGDKARVVFDAPNLLPGFDKAGNARSPRKPSSGNPSGLISLLLVLGVVGFLLTGGNSGGNSPAAEVTAEPYIDPTLASTDAAIRVRWKRNAFSNSRYAYRWQIWRSDVGDSPVMVAPGQESSVINTSLGTATPFVWLNAEGISGGGQIFDAPENATGVTRALQSGRPYRYSIELVSKVASIDRPDAGNNTTGNNTTGTNTGTNTTTTTTTDTTTDDGGDDGDTGDGEGEFAYDYVISDRQTARGLATALVRPQLISPADGAQLSGVQVFSFQSVSNPTFTNSIEYVLEFSSSRDFRRANTYQVARLTESRAGTLSFPSIDVNSSSIPSSIRNASEIYWRIGARSTSDNPGPAPEQSDWERYVFSSRRAFKPPVGPPPPP